MYLQLAEGSSYIPPSVYLAEKKRKGFTYVRKYHRRGGMVRAHYRSLAEEDLDNPYIILPAHISPTGTRLAVREDYFDDLSDDEWRSLMWQLMPFQPQVQRGMSENLFLASRADRKKRREERKQRKEEKKRAKVDKKKAKNELRRARAEAKREGRGADILGTVGDTLSNIFGKKGEDESESPLPTEGEPTKAGFTMPKIFGIPAWIPIVAAGGAIYLATRKRRR